MTTSVLDPVGAFAAVDHKLTLIDDPAVQRNLAAFRDRMAGELLGDTERVFATVTTDFTLVTRAAGSAETVAEYATFRAMFTGAADAGIAVWSNWDHLVVDADTLIAHGTLYTAMPAAVAGLKTDEPDSLALSTSTAVVIFEFVDGLTQREILYSDPATRTVVAISKSAIPDRATLLAELLH